MYYSRNRTITCRLFLWALLFAIFFFVPDLQAQESAKEKLLAPSMDSWINSIATFAVSLGVLFLLLVFSVLVIMFWGVVSSIKSIINVFTEKEREDISMSQEQIRCRLATMKTKITSLKNIRNRLEEIKTKLATIKTQTTTLKDIQSKLEEIKTKLNSINVQNPNLTEIHTRLTEIGVQTRNLTDMPERISNIENILNNLRDEIQRLRREGDR